MNGQVSLTSDVHNTQLVQTFGHLFRNKILTDVTLLCEDKFKIEAHKVVLCAGSNFFREFFSNNTKDHLILADEGQNYLLSEKLSTILFLLLSKILNKTCLKGKTIM